MAEGGGVTDGAGGAGGVCGGVLVRNGPGEAVRMMRSTAPAWAVLNTWKIALCSESTGNRVAPHRAISAIMSGPAETRHSLLANATQAPRRIAVRVDDSPATPPTPDITRSARHP